MHAKMGCILAIWPISPKGLVLSYFLLQLENWRLLQSALQQLISFDLKWKQLHFEKIFPDGNDCTRCNNPRQEPPLIPKMS